jgi:hypothetical protein
MEDPRKLRELAGWYREFAERAGNPDIWEARLRTAKDFEREADRFENMEARRDDIAQRIAEHVRKFDSRSADAARQGDRVVNKPGTPFIALLTPQLKHRLVAGAVAAMLAFAVGLLVVVFGAWAADEPARSRPTAERAGTDTVRVQPTAKQVAPLNQPDVGTSDANYIEQLYRQLIGPPSATASGSNSGSRLRAAPNDAAAGSVRRWTSPR